MKYIIIILLIFIGFNSFAQRFPSGFPTQANTGWNKWGYGQTDSGLIVANRDTTWLAKFSATIVYRPNDKKFYYFDSTTLRWYQLVPTAIDTTSLSNRINLKLNIVDTTGKWLSQSSRLVDTLYRVNDSTVGFTIKGVPYTFKILGRPPTSSTGTVTSVGLSMPAAFTVTGSPITTSGTFNVSGAGTSSQYIRGDGTLATMDTSAIPSFFSKVRSEFSGTSPITYNSTTGAIGIQNATASGTKGAATFVNSSFSDNGSGTIDLANVVTAGGCITCNLSIDSKGRITSYANGQPPTIVNAPGAGDTLSTNDTIKRLFAGYGILHDITQYNIVERADTISSNGLVTKYMFNQAVLTANNGLTKTGNNIQWGGTLLQHTLVDGGANYESRFTSANPSGSGRYTMTIKNSALFGNALRAEGVDGGTGIDAVSSTGYAANVTSNSGVALQASTGANTAIIANVNPSSTNTIHEAVAIIRTTTGTPANGEGLSIDLANLTSVQSRVTNQIISKLTDVTDATYTSQYEIWGANNGTLARKMAIAGNGQITLDQYTGTNFQTIDTSFNALVVDGSGNIFKRAGDHGSGGGGTPTLDQVLGAGNSGSNKDIFLYRNDGGNQVVNEVHNLDTTSSNSVARFNTITRRGRAAVCLESPWIGDAGGSLGGNQVQWFFYKTSDTTHWAIVDSAKFYEMGPVLLNDTSHRSLRLGFQLVNVYKNMFLLNFDTLGRCGLMNVVAPQAFLHVPSGAYPGFKMDPEGTPTNSTSGDIHNTGNNLTFADLSGGVHSLVDQVTNAPDGSFTGSGPYLFTPGISFASNHNVGFWYSTTLQTQVAVSNNANHATITLLNSNASGWNGHEIFDNNFNQQAAMIVDNADNTKLWFLTRGGKTMNWQAGSGDFGTRTAQMSLTTGGNFLIGTTSDNAAFLQIGANTTSNAQIFLNGSTSNVTSPTNGMLWYNSTAHTLNFRDNGTTFNLLAANNTIYAADGTLAGNRTVTGSNNNLTFAAIGTYRINSNGLVMDQNATGFPYSGVVIGTGSHNFQLGYTPTTLVYTKGAGLYIDTNNNVGLGVSVPTTAPMYSSGGTPFLNGLQNQGANFNRVDSIATSITLNTSEYFIRVDASGGAITLTLPAASSVFGSSIGIVYKIQKIDASGNAVTISRSGANTINGATSQTISTQYDVHEVQCTSTTTWAYK